MFPVKIKWCSKYYTQDTSNWAAENGQKIWQKWYEKFSRKSEIDVFVDAKEQMCNSRKNWAPDPILLFFCFSNLFLAFDKRIETYKGVQMWVLQY